MYLIFRPSPVALRCPGFGHSRYIFDSILYNIPIVTVDMGARNYSSRKGKARFLQLIQQEVSCYGFALAMGEYYFTDAKGTDTRVEYSFGYIHDNRSEGFARTGYSIPAHEEVGGWEIHVSSAAAAPWLEPLKIHKIVED